MTCWFWAVLNGLNDGPAVVARELFPSEPQD